MRTKTIAVCAAATLAGLLGAAAKRSGAVEAAGRDARRQEIEAFNARLLEAHLKMDTPAILDLWAEDGVSLLPETAPLIGKPAIGKFLAGVTEQLRGWRMKEMQLDFQGIESSGDWASEWATEHQVVEPPDPGQPAFDGRGKMLLVLYREADGKWRIKREMWNQGQKKNAR